VQDTLQGTYLPQLLQAAGYFIQLVSLGVQPALHIIKSLVQLVSLGVQPALHIIESLVQLVSLGVQPALHIIKSLVHLILKEPLLDLCDEGGSAQPQSGRSPSNA